MQQVLLTRVSAAHVSSLLHALAEDLIRRNGLLFQLEARNQNGSSSFWTRDGFADAGRRLPLKTRGVRRLLHIASGLTCLTKNQSHVVLCLFILVVS